MRARRPEGTGTAYRRRGNEDIPYMGNFRLRSGSTQKCTSIPNSFIEKYMPTAAGEFVKIYIYLLKCVNENQDELSISKIADVFNNTEKDTIRALKYWHRNGLLSLSFEENELKSLTITLPGNDGEESAQAGEPVTLNVETTAKTAPVQTASEEAPAQERKALQAPEKPQFSRSQLDAFSKEDDVPQLLYVIQKYMGTAISGSSLNTIMFIKKTLGFSSDLIEYLFDYCVSCGHKSIRYIEKTAINWAGEGIGTVEAAKAMNNVHDRAYKPVREAFGIKGRGLAPAETDFVNKWVLSYGFGMDLICEACRRTIKNTHEASFEYADAILCRWKKDGTDSLEKVKLSDERFEESRKAAAKTSEPRVSKTAANSKFNNFRQRSYDYAELEKKLLSN